MELVLLEGRAVWASQEGAVILRANGLAALDQHIEQQDPPGGNIADSPVVYGYQGTHKIKNARSPPSSFTPQVISGADLEESWDDLHDTVKQESSGLDQVIKVIFK